MIRCNRMPCAVTRVSLISASRAEGRDVSRLRKVGSIKPPYQTPSRRRSVDDRQQIASAPRVLIEEAAADLEILVVAGWQCGLLILGKPLREGDHFAGRRRSPGGWPLLGLGAVVLSALTDHLVRSFLGFAPAPGFGSCLFRGGRCMTASVALTARRRPSASYADRCRLVQVDGAAIVLPEHRDQ